MGKGAFLVGSTKEDMKGFSEQARRETGLELRAMNEKIERASDNIFEDRGFEGEEAANLLIRADLLIELRQRIRRSNLTQMQAAELLGLKQPDVSNLLKGKIDKFSIDKLVNMLAAVGQRVTVKFPKHRLQAIDGGTDTLAPAQSIASAREAKGGRFVSANKSRRNTAIASKRVAAKKAKNGSPNKKTASK